MSQSKRSYDGAAPRASRRGSVSSAWTIAISHRRLSPASCSSAILSFGILESYQKNRHCHCDESGCGVDPRPHFHRQIAQSRQRLHHRHQRGHSGALSGLLALRPLQPLSRSCRSTCLRVKGRHIWNPSNFGISVMLFLAPETVASLSIQWGNYLLPMLVIWVLGSVIIWRVRRFHITATYVVSFCRFRLCCAAGSPAVPGNRKSPRSPGPCTSSSSFS